MESWAAVHLYRLPPESNPAATMPLSLSSVQQQYRLPPGSHPAAAATLPLTLSANSNNSSFSKDRIEISIYKIFLL
jgi:hypothetical protein